MDKVQRNKKILIFVGIILLLLAVVVCTLKSCSGEKTSGDSDRDKVQEVVIEEKESEEGLDIAGPDDADESDSKGAVEFIGPDEATSNSQTPSKDNGVENNESANDNSDSEKKENADNTSDKVEKEENGNNESQNGGLDEEATESKTGKYGTFF